VTFAGADTHQRAGFNVLHRRHAWGERRCGEQRHTRSWRHTSCLGCLRHRQKISRS
jgi:hypothetical protein